jgi:signal transduction histidine kinase
VERISRLPLDQVCRLAARLAEAPMARITLVGRDREYPAGGYGPPPDEARAFLGVPVKDREGRPVGTLAVLDTEERTWADGPTGTLRDLAALLEGLAVAHDLTQLRRAERFRACHQAVERSLRTSSAPSEAAPGVLAAVGTTLGWPAAELWLVDEGSGELEYTGGWTAPGTDLRGVLGMPVTPGAGITGRVWATGRPLWVPDIADTFTLRSAVERVRAEICLRQGIRTVLAVPVRDGGTVLGVLTCYAGAPERHEDLLTVLLDGVAAQIGVHVALRRAEGLARQLTRAKDDFIALVGHEMRTPLTTIVANATMLAEEGGALPDELRAMLDAVLRNSTVLRQVVTTLLDLAGLDSGYLDLNVRRVDLAVVVAEAVEQARGRAGDAVALTLAGAGPFPLAGDAYRLRQAVDDVLANAIKFSLPGGRVRVALAPGDGVVELTVTDDGIGTPDDERDRVFDRFYRGSNVRHQGISGHGLGLSLARTIVQRHGGSIRLTGHRPSGTKVLIRLPVKPQPDTPDIRSDKCDDE